MEPTMVELATALQEMTAHQLRRAMIEFVQILGPQKELRTVLDVLDVVRAEVPKSLRRR